MATAQEILAKIKESKRKENENLFRMAENGSNGHSNTIHSSTTNGSLHRLSTVNYTYEQEYELYINLVTYYIIHPSIIPPLHPYQKMLQKVVPRVYNKLYANGTYYCMIGFNKQLLNTVVMLSDSIEEFNKIISTLFASIPKVILNDINDVLQNRRAHNASN